VIEVLGTVAMSDFILFVRYFHLNPLATYNLLNFLVGCRWL